MKSPTLLVVASAASVLPVSAALAQESKPVFAGLPNPVPPFASADRARQKFDLTVGEVVDGSGCKGIQPVFESGGKSVAFHWNPFRNYFNNPAGISILANNQEVASVNVSGWIPDVGGGSPFKGKDDSKGAIAADAGTNSVRFTKEFQYSNEATAPFTYTITSVGDGKLRLDWKLGLTQAQIDALPPRSDLRFDIALKGNYAKSDVLLNSEKIQLLTDDQLAALEVNRGQVLKEGPQGGVVQVGSQDADNSFAVQVSDAYAIRFEESRSQGTPARVLMIRVQPRKLAPEGSLMLDLGKTRIEDKSAPPPVRGVDFWKHDRLHIPLLPTRNLMPNPSFEQGMRYWIWRMRGGGGRYDPKDNKAPAYEVSSDAKFGLRALKMNKTFGNRSIVSLPLALVPGKSYTVSYYSKGGGVNVGVTPALPVEGDWNTLVTYARAAASPDWQRTTFTFTAKFPAERLDMEALGECLVDGIQIEEGAVATEFASAPVEGRLTSADPDNSLQKGKPLNLAVELSGAPNAKGKVTVDVRDFYRESRFNITLDYSLDAKGYQRIPLALTGEQTGTGVFVTRVDYESGPTRYTDYYRFSVLDFLENKHATKDLFGLGLQAGWITRGDDLGEMYKRWGFGSTTYQNGTLDPEFFTKHRISNLLNQGSPTAHSAQWLPQPFKDIFFAWEEMTPEREKIVEDLAFKAASAPRVVGDVWAFNTESEGHTRMALLDKWDEFIKLQMAAKRGFERARPNAIVLPDGGTSGFKSGRGYVPMEKQLQASQGKVKWDGLAIHPYGSYDDMDESIAYLKALDAKYNPGANTPLYIPESSPGERMNIPEWQKIAQYFEESSGFPGYDSGWRDFVGTAISARMYLIGLKHWPRVRNVNQWIFRPFLDINFAPQMVCGTTNTLGHLFGEPRFIEDFAPVAEIKGMIFEDQDKRGLAAVWTNATDVEIGTSRGAQIKIKTGGQALEFIDLMGNVRMPEVKNGEVTVPLSPAPIFIRTAPGKTSSLVASMRQAEVAGSSNVVAVSFQPTLNGDIAASITNQTGNALSGQLTWAQSNARLNLASKATQDIVVAKPGNTKFGQSFTWNSDVALNISTGFQFELTPKVHYFYVPRVAAPLPSNPDDPRWAAIPRISLTNFQQEAGVAGGHAGDLEAGFRLAWDRDNLYLKLDAKDDKFLPGGEEWNKTIKKIEALYKFDGSLEVYFDTFANARSKTKPGYDDDDYRYDFYAGDGKAQTGPGSIFRRQEVFKEYAGGPSMPTRQEVEQGGIKTMFTRTGENYSYTIIFPQRFILPMSLKAGTRAGFGLFLHDRDIPGQYKGRSLATEPGKSPNVRPDLWPTMVLSDQTAG